MKKLLLTFIIGGLALVTPKTASAQEFYVGGDISVLQSYQDNNQALQKASAEKMQAITAKILDAIKSVGQTGGYVYIMENNSLPYISTTLSTDVTAQVKANLGLK